MKRVELKKQIFFVVAWLIILFLALPYLWGRNNIPPRVYFGNTRINGSFSEAVKPISQIADAFEKAQLVVIYQDRKIKTTFAEVGLKIDRQKTAENLQTAFTDSTKFPLKWWVNLFWGYQAQAAYNFDIAKTEDLTGSKFNVVLTPVQEASVQFLNGKTVLVPAKEGMGIDSMAVVAQILKDLKEWKNEDILIKVSKVEPEIPTSAAENLKRELDARLVHSYLLQAGTASFNLTPEIVISWIQIQKKENTDNVGLNSNEAPNQISNAVVTGQNFSDSKTAYHLEWELDRGKIRNYVDQQVQGAIYRSPVNGMLAFQNGAIVETSPATSEITADVDASTEKIVQAVKGGQYSVKLPVNENPAALSLENVHKIGANSLLATGESSFTGSPQNRRHNIGVGASKFNGVIIPQGEEFSFLTTLGPVDQSTDYLPELVIKVDKTIPEYGGGMCQVSTTCFRAAVNAGLRVTERQNHAYPVQYYSPQGTDATVYIPHPDLKFVNDTPGPILIQTRITGNILTFEFFGQSDGRTVQLEGPTVSDKKPDGSMKAQWIQRVYAQDGSLMFQKNFLSKYDSPSKYPHPGDEKPPTEKKKKGGTKKKN